MNSVKPPWRSPSYWRDIFAWLLIVGGLISVLSAIDHTMSQPTTPWRYSYIYEID